LGLLLLRHTSATGKVIFILVIAPLWMFSNLTRILILILFRIPAHTLSHEIIGLTLFAAILLFPILIIALLFPEKSHRFANVNANANGDADLDYRFKKDAIDRSHNPISQNSKLYKSFRTAEILLILTLSIMVIFFPPTSANRVRNWPTVFADYSLTDNAADPSIATYRKGEYTLILKRDLFAPGTAHDPHICFNAIGFSFQEESLHIKDNSSIKSALVIKNNKPARLLWWYHWKNNDSASDFAWRVARLLGKDVVQLNLYGADDKEIEIEKEKIIAFLRNQIL
jgi:hypothetical protein